MNLKARAKLLKREIPALFIALRKKETPIPAKLLAAFAVGYALSPIDLIPDFIPVIGLLDDLIIVPMLAALAIKLIPQQIMAQCREEAENLWINGKPKKWYFAIPIVLLWIVLLGCILRHFISG